MYTCAGVCALTSAVHPAEQRTSQDSNPRALPKPRQTFYMALRGHLLSYSIPVQAVRDRLVPIEHQEGKVGAMCIRVSFHLAQSLSDRLVRRYGTRNSTDISSPQPRVGGTDTAAAAVEWASWVMGKPRGDPSHV